MKISRLPVLRNLSSRGIAAAYNKSLMDLREQAHPAHKQLAVVIHMYYVDNWDYFRKKLAVLSDVPFDLYITLPPQNVEIIKTIRKTYPDVRYLVSPNRGRDVLPFVMAAKYLQETGYESILKFHSKKSLHWEGGDDWLHETLDDLLPEPGTAPITDIVGKLKQADTGILGPAKYYYPLTINFPANGPHMTELLTRIYDRKVAHDVLQLRRKEYGFFGGTMFWCRMSAIEKILAVVRVADFEAESGQIDATFAHALERIFCVVPEIENRKMYESEKGVVKQRDYASANIPEWSEDHDK